MEPQDNKRRGDDRAERLPGDYFPIEREVLEAEYPAQLPKLRAKLLYVLEQSDEEKGNVPGPERGIFKYGSLVKEGVLPPSAEGGDGSATESEGNDGHRFSKWKNPKKYPTANWPWGKESALALLNHLFKKSFWSLDEYRRRYEALRTDGYFDALVRQMRCERTTEQNLRYTAPGVYQVWRQSIVLPRRYVLGLFAVYRVRSNETDADRPLKTIELHRLRGAIGGNEGGADLPIVQVPELEEIYLGYMVKKSRQILVHSFDATTRAFHLTVITNSYRASAAKGGSFTVLAGVTTGLLGQQSFYTFPLVMIRDDAASKALDAAASSPAVVAALESEQRDAEKEAHKARSDYSDGISASEAKMLDAVRRLPLYGQLDLVEEDRVPLFVKEQLRTMVPRNPPPLGEESSSS